ncbi:DUF1501 domain-containing protein [Niveispirillum irakense]|uniref:DUF1501 domain-containing protein n=1 Tax=Niveispirillum irakense TaxID=34011 RepID=UPI000405B2BA|nr:DUF1501 domain-containing protein [Niveispirillum irakense]
MHRRQFLNAALAATGGLALAASPFRVAFADARTDHRLVLVVLRGAMDGLGAVAPYADPDYRTIRGGLALAEPGQPDGVLDLDGHFGLHPALAPIHGWWQEGGLLVAHAIATPYRERSHFDAQDLLESGGNKPGRIDSGWLNRALGRLDGGGRGLGLALGQGVPLVMRGTVPVASWAPSTLPEPTDDFLARVMNLYEDDAVLGPALNAGLGIADMAQQASGIMPGKPRAKDRILLATTAGRMLADPAGPRVAVMDIQGWDTHVGQGAAKGRLANALGDLSDVLINLREGLGEAWGKSVVAVVTEFGRTVRPNGTNGTDHGTAGVAFLAGGAVEGGRVIGTWPGLREDKLYENRDLAPTTDMRALLKGVLRDHMGVPASALDRQVFPDDSKVRALPDLIRA